jgi:hypothetical protein
VNWLEVISKSGDFLNRKLARRNQVWLVRNAFYKAVAACWNFSSMNSGESAKVLAP